MKGWLEACEEGAKSWNLLNIKKDWESVLL